MRRGSFAVAGFALGLGAGCPTLPPYVCDDDASCDRGGAQGRCLDDGACAYPDGACDSGWVRSPNAAVQPGVCVDGGGVSSSGGRVTAASTTSDSGTSSAPGTSDTGPIPSCGARIQFAIDTAFFGAAEVLEGYPAAVRIDAPELIAAILDGGVDPWVTDTTGAPVPHEVERLDADSGLLLWVRMPSYELDEEVALELRFGAAPPDTDPTQVWAGRYAGVWHMDDALSGVDGDAIRNSAVPSEAGRSVGGMLPAQNVAGVIGRGLAFDGIDDIVTVDAAFVGALDSYAISMWIRFDGPDDAPGDYFQRLNGDFFYPRCWRQAAGSVFCQYIVDGDVTGLGSGLGQEVDQLLHLVMVRDADAATHRLYIDGEEVNETTDPIGASLPAQGYPFEIGHGELGTLPGMIDEVRVSQVPLSAAWVRADYRTQLEPGLVLASLDAIEPVPCDR